ncbi:peptide ABC transporter substrate-binding protein [Phytomonospora endophytica]|uniref:ABC-type transport system substrate-binding protein n=1 Tax=Phytomonospora endophytica TaxID=714109 RepID=A0A841FBT8_9ACTN|nr:ABC transporter substrate-binding protein [Phytomonospora endophytica]MBB6033254.1 ABC-type transport system substrate-binding protein [Phytomonospora endophytica]GIG65480.1 putative peptide ABC transporter DppA [Phytomonospora endophytica]
MRSKRVLSAVAVAAIAGLVVTACGSGDGDGGSDGAGEINLSLGEPKSLIPPNIGETEGGAIARLVYSGLYDYGNDGSLVPVIADGQPTTTDNKVWTIKLKTGFKFQNGEEINAELFKKSWDFAVDGRNANGGSYFFSKISGFADTQSGADPDGEEGPKKGADPKADELTGVKAVDATTLEITLDKPWVIFPQLLGYTAFFPTAEGCRTAVDACNETPIGNGPFKFVGKWEHETAIKLTRWDEYTAEKSSYKDLNFKIYTGSSVAWPDFQAGTVDIAAPTPDAYNDAKSTYGDKMIEADSPSTWSLGYPVYDEIFSDVKVRQAFSMAIDRQAIIDAIFQGQGKVLDSLTPSMIPGFKAGTCAYCKVDVEGAKALLDSSKWTKGKKLELWTNTSPTGEKILKAIGDQLNKNLGIEYELKTLEWPEYLQKKTDQEITGPFFTGWQPDYPSIENYMAPLYSSIAKDGSDNDFGFYNAQYEALMAEGDTAPDMNAANAKYQEAETILGTELPIAPLFTRMTSTVIGERIDFDSVNRNPILGTIDFVKLKLA